MEGYSRNYRIRILLTGGGGQIGWELRRALSSLGSVTAPTSRDLDLAEPESIRPAVRELRPGLIVNAAAYTAVDAAEEERDLAWAVNATAPGVLSEEAERLGAALVHYSTDYVFDGEKGEPYVEEDEPAPINYYGETKLAGERAVQEGGAPHLVLRTSWVYGLRGKNFLLTMLRLAREREELRVVSDQVGSPTWSRVIADTTAQILAQGRGDPAGFLRESSGLYHLSAAGQTSWHGFAQAIFEKDPRKEEQVLGSLEPIPTSQYPTPARRAPYSVLDNESLRRSFGLRPPDWEEQLGLALADREEQDG